MKIKLAPTQRQKAIIIAINNDLPTKKAQALVLRRPQRMKSVKVQIHGSATKAQGYFIT